MEAATATTAFVKSEFRNESGGVQGAIIIDADGKTKGIAVMPDETIWLSEQEEILTANAPKDNKDNPFANGAYVLVTKAQEVVNRRPIGTHPGVETAEVATPEAREEASTDPPGRRGEDEEVATPDATDPEPDDDAALDGVEDPEDVQVLPHQGQPVRRSRRKAEG